MYYTITINSENLIKISNSLGHPSVSYKYFLQEDDSLYKFDTPNEAAEWVVNNIKSNLIDYENDYIKSYLYSRNTCNTRLKYLK